MRTSLVRTISLVVMSLVLLLLLLGASLQVMVRNYLNKSSFAELNSEAEVISTLAEAYYAEGSISPLDFLVNLSVVSRVSGSDAFLCRMDGSVLLCSSDPFTDHYSDTVLPDTLLAELAEKGTVQRIGRVGGIFSEENFYAATIITDQGNENIGIVLVCSSTESVREIMQDFSKLVLTISMLVVLAGIPLAVLFTRKKNNELMTLAHAANTFGHGDLSARVNFQEEVSDEINEVALAFNNMASSLQKSEYQRQQFVANVSHELKTPMTTIGGYIDGILDGTIPQAKQRYYMEIVSEETKRLSRLVRSMLDISQLQDQDRIPEEKKNTFDIEECAGQVLLTFEKKINDKHLEVEVDMPEHTVHIRACEDYLTQVIYNLIDNAVKFSPDGGTLSLKIQEGGGKAYVSVANQGETIPPEELPLVFDRFHKLDKSRSQNRDGWGLGLYIVKTIICVHGENISVTSRDGRTEFTFTMPLESNLYAEVSQ